VLLNRFVVFIALAIFKPSSLGQTDDAQGGASGVANFIVWVFSRIAANEVKASLILLIEWVVSHFRIYLFHIVIGVHPVIVRI
jgi:hypothetical protein